MILQSSSELIHTYTHNAAIYTTGYVCIAPVRVHSHSPCVCVFVCTHSIVMSSQFVLLVSSDWTYVMFLLETVLGRKGIALVGSLNPKNIWSVTLSLRTPLNEGHL